MAGIPGVSEQISVVTLHFSRPSVIYKNRNDEQKPVFEDFANKVKKSLKFC